MKGIPPELDRLLWAVAEDEGTAAGDEFVQRYPKLAGELARRRQMIRGLKGGRTAVTESAHPTPVFRPKATVSRPMPSRRVMISVGALVLGAVAVASYTLSGGGFGSRPVTKVPIVRKVPLDPPKITPQVVYREPGESVRPNNGGEDQATPPTVATQEEPPGPKPVNFHVAQAKLSDALSMLAAQARLRVTMAPGFPSVVVDADYENQTVAAILIDLGKRYHFTAFDQGDGSIIVVPAVASTAENVESSRIDPLSNDPKSP